MRKVRLGPFDALFPKRLSAGSGLTVWIPISDVNVFAGPTGPVTSADLTVSPGEGAGRLPALSGSVCQKGGLADRIASSQAETIKSQCPDGALRHCTFLVPLGQTMSFSLPSGIMMNSPCRVPK